MKLNQELNKKFEKNILNNIKLLIIVGLIQGGPAEYLFKPLNKKQLIEFLKDNQKIN